MCGAKTIKNYFSYVTDRPFCEVCYVSCFVEPVFVPVLVMPFVDTRLCILLPACIALAEGPNKFLAVAFVLI
jgi:hypothetical protein